MTTPPQDPGDRTPDESTTPPPTAPPPAPGAAEQPWGQAPQAGSSQPGPPQGYAQPPAQQYQQPQYQQPQYYAQPAPPNPAQAKNWMGITSLVLSLLGLVTGITAIAGIIFGHLSLGAVKRGEADNRGVGLAGLIIGYVMVVLGILATIAFFLFFGWIVSECGGDNPADWCTSETTWEWESTNA